jgi:hypothetical protein
MRIQLSARSLILGGAKEMDAGLMLADSTVKKLRERRSLHYSRQDSINP